MEASEPALAFEGLHCPSCGYDLRGLGKSVCPECGSPFDPATLAIGRLPSPRVGIVAAALNVALAGFVLWRSIELPCSYVAQLGGWCGTGRGMTAFAMSHGVGWIVALTGLGWLVAAWARYAAPIARCAFLVAVCAWLIGNAAIEFWPYLV